MSWHENVTLSACAGICITVLSGLSPCQARAVDSGCIRLRCQAPSAAGISCGFHPDCCNTEITRARHGVEIPRPPGLSLASGEETPESGAIMVKAGDC